MSEERKAPGCSAHGWNNPDCRACASLADILADIHAGTITGHRFGSPPEPVANPNEAWCERYADWYYQGKG